MNDEELIKKRLIELANRAYTNNCYEFTDFLNMSELSIFYQMKNELKFAGADVNGGHQTSERCMVRFGDENLCGYTLDYPILIIKISPANAKFADKLSHRDFLGSIMGLGIERSKIGDIFVDSETNTGYVFVHLDIADYILTNLSFIRHTKVKNEIIEELPEVLLKEPKEKVLTLSSNRIDAVISKAYNLSRGVVINLIKENKVYINGCINTSNSISLKKDDVVSVRGYGRFVFAEELGLNKKEKIKILIKIY